MMSVAWGARRVWGESDVRGDGARRRSAGTHAGVDGGATWPRGALHRDVLNPRYVDWWPCSSMWNGGHAMSAMDHEHLVGVGARDAREEAFS